jgi:hypothetical protein
MFQNVFFLDITLTVQDYDFDITYLLASLIFYVFVRSCVKPVGQTQTAKIVKLAVCLMFFSFSAKAQTCEGFKMNIQMKGKFDLTKEIDYRLVQVVNSETRVFSDKFSKKEFYTCDFKECGIYTVIFSQKIFNQTKELSCKFDYAGSRNLKLIQDFKFQTIQN